MTPFNDECHDDLVFSKVSDIICFAFTSIFHENAKVTLGIRFCPSMFFSVDEG
jgi:hypothetical protein